MDSSIIKIGNSKGVRIPKALLEQSGIDKDITIIASEGEIRILKARPKPKKVQINEEYLLSLKALREDWDSPEEDEAWQHLQ